MTASTNAKHHLGPIKTRKQNAYVTARLSNEITGSEKQEPDRGNSAQK